MKTSMIQFIKFGFVGLSNTVVSLIIYYVFIYMGCHYLLANTFSWLISVGNSYFWNHRYVFSSSSFWLTSLSKTYIAYFLSYIIGTLFLYVSVSILDISEIVAPFFIIILTTPINFLMNKYWAFKY